MAVQREFPLRADLGFLGEQTTGEALAFADALDLDGSRFDDLLDAGDSRRQLGILGGGGRREAGGGQREM